MRMLANDSGSNMPSRTHCVACVASEVKFAVSIKFTNSSLVRNDDNGLLFFSNRFDQNAYYSPPLVVNCVTIEGLFSCKLCVKIDVPEGDLKLIVSAHSIVSLTKLK